MNFLHPMPEGITVFQASTLLLRMVTMAKKGPSLREVLLKRVIRYRFKKRLASNVRILVRLENFGLNRIRQIRQKYVIQALPQT